MHTSEQKAFTLLQLIISLGLLATCLLIFTTTLYPQLKNNNDSQAKNNLQETLSTLEAHIQSLSLQEVEDLLKPSNEIFVYKDTSNKPCIIMGISKLMEQLNSDNAPTFPLQKIQLEMASLSHFTKNISYLLPLKLSGTTLYQITDLDKRSKRSVSKILIKRP